MNPDFFRYIKKNILTTAILAITAWLVFFYIIPKHYFNGFPYILLFFCLFGIFVQHFLYKIAKMKVGKFATRFMAVTMMKLFIMLIGVVIFVLVDRENAIPFVVVFFILYVVYTALEVSDIMPVANKN